MNNISYGVLIVQVLTALHATAAIKEISTLEEYEKVCKPTKPTVIVFNSATCEACTMMKPHMEAAAKKYETKADFYTLDASTEGLKELPKKAGLKAYPTTHFLKPGTDPRVERGSMSEVEIETITSGLVGEERKEPQRRMYQPKKPAEAPQKEQK